MSEVELVPVEIQVGKETKEVADALEAVVIDLKAGKKFDAITGNLEKLSVAVQGYEMLDDEQKHESRHATRGYVGMKISSALESKPEAEPTPEEPVE